MVTLCKTCLQFIHGSRYKEARLNESVSNACFACLGFWQDDKSGSTRSDLDHLPNNGNEPSFDQRLTQAVIDAAKPYGGVSTNRFALGSSCININDQPRVVLPGDLVHRYKLATLQELESCETLQRPVTSVSVFADRIKKDATERLNYCLENLPQKPLTEMQAEYPPDVTRDELGYLGIQVILTPHKGLLRPVDLIPPSLHEIQSTKRSRRQRQQLDISQGGDPRTNQEERVDQANETRIWTVNQAVATSHKSSQRDADILQASLVNLQPQHAMDIHVSIWRKPFYLGAKYTKSRRDVSQTPFFVHDHGPTDSTSTDASLVEVKPGNSKRRRLGVTSVEEQILPVMGEFVGGISTHNEQYTPMQNGRRFGMIKFHASGREDMNVRMMLPKTETEGKTICGRPFVCEITDALRMPSKQDLVDMVKTINHVASAQEASSSANAKDHSRSYGCNPLGVDISPDLSFVHASAYSCLQAETEEKVKYYACYCWSQEPFANQYSLQEQLQRHTFPLEIQQTTPIRVLHRRVNMTRTRHVLSCFAERTDDHHFVLHISTDAGTYVKEWCHGDLGRTIPNLFWIHELNTFIQKVRNVTDPQHVPSLLTKHMEFFLSFSSLEMSIHSHQQARPRRHAQPCCNRICIGAPMDHSLPENRPSVDISEDSRTLVAITNHGAVYVWDPTSYQWYDAFHRFGRLGHATSHQILVSHSMLPPVKYRIASPHASRAWYVCNGRWKCRSQYDCLGSLLAYERVRTKPAWPALLLAGERSVKFY